MKKIIGIIGLGKMGGNITMNLLSKKWKVVVHNRSLESINKLKSQGATPAHTIQELINKLPSPKVILLSLPAGKPVDQTIKSLTTHLKKGDILIDSGNSLYKDSIKRHNKLTKKGIFYIDMGTSGGTQGARYGASLMIGGDKKAFKKIELLFRDIAIKNGYAYLGPTGAGHYVKIIHNGIEYAILEAYAEGLQVLDDSKYKYNYGEVLKVWNNGSIIRSYITQLAEKVFRKDPKLKSSPGIIGGHKTGQWAYQAAKENNSEFKTLKNAIDKRKLSKTKQSFSTKFVSLIRNAFGGHPIEKK
jgi:6-phosphogluconate dehydrogenase